MEIFIFDKGLINEKLFEKVIESEFTYGSLIIF